jgi:glycosyltransferase involved in cell wall biosynthesis
VDDYNSAGNIPDGCQLVNTGAHNAASNRNVGVRLYDGEAVVFLDDDITGLSSRQPSIEQTDDPDPHMGRGVRQRRLTSRGFISLVNTWARLLTDTDVKLVTANTTNNSGFTARFNSTQRFVTNVLLVGQIMCFRASETFLFDESLNMTDDVDLGMRLMSSGTIVARDRSVAVYSVNRTKDKPVVPGGITEFIDQRRQVTDTIVSRYPDLLRPPRKGSTMPTLKKRQEILHFDYTSGIVIEDDWFKPSPRDLKGHTGQ